MKAHPRYLMSPVAEHLGNLHGIVKPYKGSRNSIAHREPYWEDAFRYTQLYGLTSPDVNDPHWWLGQLAADVFTKEKGEEFSGMIDRIEASSGRLLSALLTEFESVRERRDPPPPGPLRG